jgi:aminoglycoside phosphotransferase (APT) family kinase protein
MTDINTPRLADWLRENVENFRGALRITTLTGGQSNPTYRIDADTHRWVLRRKPPGALLASAHAVDREFRVLQALQRSDVPVPRVHALCTDETVIGSMFYIMDFVEGRTFIDPSLPGMDPSERLAIYQELQRVLAAIHSVDIHKAGLTDFGRPGNYLARQRDRWAKQYRTSQTETISAMDNLIDWLHANPPPEGDTTLVHGDFRIDNVLFHPTEPRALAVIDWELSTLGNPEVDLAYHAMAWHLSPEEFRGLRGHNLTSLGIPSEAEQLVGWSRLSGRSVPNDWVYYLVFNMFRLACILQGILARAKQGNAASDDAEKTGQRARLIAQAGWSLASARIDGAGGESSV